MLDHPARRTLKPGPYHSRLPRPASNASEELRSAMAITSGTGKADLFAAKRAAMREEFFAKLFLLGGWPGGTDTYKRTMWAAVPDVALARAGYALTMRKGLPEPGADNQLIMAGHEAMLAQWFHRPLKRTDIELARRWFHERAAVRAFPDHLWDTILERQPAE